MTIAEYFIISDVQIKGLWNSYNLSFNANKKINIFIGANGSGKTTLINLIHNALNVDVEAFFTHIQKNYESQSVGLPQQVSIVSFPAKSSAETNIHIAVTSNEAIAAVPYLHMNIINPPHSAAV